MTFTCLGCPQQLHGTSILGIVLFKMFFTIVFFVNNKLIIRSAVLKLCDGMDDVMT